MEDARKELERIEKALLEEETQDLEDIVNAVLDEDADHADQIDISLDELLGDSELGELLSEDPQPAFDDPEKIHDPEEGMVYNNFANDYGTDGEEAAAAQKKKDDKILIILMSIVSALCLGIVGLLIYWLVVFL